ncbi:MAG: signal peptidase I [Dehalococcoidia bacterium]|nr:signal peptidase I [Dehalococcoidia bacterium]
MKVLREVLIYIVVGAGLYSLMQLTMQNYTVVYTSMLPGIHQGDWVRVEKVTYWFSDPKRGDVIVLEPPQGASETPYIKRIIGLPGDRVEVVNGKVIVNGRELYEPYISAPPRYTFGPVTVPPENYFVLGDNRNNSVDSHGGWTVPRQNIIGKAWFIYWPPSRWGLVPNYDLASQGIPDPTPIKSKK